MVPCWCLRALSRRRHAAFQAAALPSELRGHMWHLISSADATALVGREGLEPSMFPMCLIYSQVPSPLGYRPMICRIYRRQRSGDLRGIRTHNLRLEGAMTLPVRRAGHMVGRHNKPADFLFQLRTIKSSRLTFNTDERTTKLSMLGRPFPASHL